MIIFLVKVRIKTLFSFFEPIQVEPLELCYLKTVLNQLEVESYIVDDLFGLSVPEGIRPEVILLTGYNVAEREMVDQARLFKGRYPGVKIMACGVHVQGNPQAFHQEAIDYVCHSLSLTGFGLLVERIRDGEEGALLSEGVDTQVVDQITGKGEWLEGGVITQINHENFRADRDLFHQHAKKTHFLEKRKVALIKGSVGCPYTCSYCYCKEMNQGHYIRADFDRMAEEMEATYADYFWIVDDVLLVDRRDALDFIDALKSRRVKGKIIAYLRADFILRERDLLKELGEIGLAEVIVGFEATDNRELEGYGKTTDATDYPAVIGLLKQNGMDLSALFMVQPDYGVKDFIKLWRFIRRNRIQVFTLSILTPMKGTKGYEKEKDRLVTQNPRKFDFLHAVVKTKLPKPLFYAFFYGIQMSMLRTRRLWRAVLRKKVAG